MKVGFFFQHPVDLSLLVDIAKRNNLEMVGVHFLKEDHIEKSNPIIFQSDENLLEQIQIAFIFIDTKNYFDIASKALKKGINVYLSSLSSCTYSELLSLNDLSFEIGIPIGFGCAGSKLIEKDEIIGNYFMMQLIRDTKSSTDDESFRRMLVNDIASFVRIKPFGLKKLRVNSLPLFSDKPKAINLRLEYDNSSVIALSITRIDESERCMLRFFSGDNGYFKELPNSYSLLSSSVLESPEVILNDNEFRSSIDSYISCIQTKSNLPFGIESAIETLSIIESINDKISSMN